jgi:hypothetical protein
MTGEELKLTAGLGTFLFTTVSRTVLGPTHRPIQWVPGSLSLAMKRPVCEANHSPSSSAEVKNAWSYTATPQYVFMAWCLVKRRVNFTFTFFLPMVTRIYIVVLLIGAWKLLHDMYCSLEGPFFWDNSDESQKC